MKAVVIVRNATQITGLKGTPKTVPHGFQKEEFDEDTRFRYGPVGRLARCLLQLRILC